MSAGSCPSSASSWYSKPPLVERPMIGGRLNGKTLAPRICCRLAEHAADQGVDRLRGMGAMGEAASRATTKAALGSAAPSSSEKPTIERTWSTPSSALIMPATRSTTSCVR